MNLGIESEKIEFKKSTSELNEAVISLSSRLRHRHAPVAQLDRVSDYGSEGCGFDLCRARQSRGCL